MYDMRTLGQYIAERRKDLGLTQTGLAELAEIPRTTVNRVESGVTKLPEAEVRRRLAKGLGVSHLDILIEAGEITAEEATQKGATVKTAGPVTDLSAMLEQIDFSDTLVLRAVRSQLRFWVENAGKKRKGD